MMDIEQYLKMCEKERISIEPADDLRWHTPIYDDRLRPERVRNVILSQNQFVTAATWGDGGPWQVLDIITDQNSYRLASLTYNWDKCLPLYMPESDWFRVTKQIIDAALAKLAEEI